MEGVRFIWELCKYSQTHHNVPQFIEPSITNNSRGSPNNNETAFPEVYERNADKGNRSLLFIRFHKQDNNLDLNS